MAYQKFPRSEVKSCRDENDPLDFGHTRLDKIRNEVIRDKIGVASIKDKMRESRLGWYGHIRRRPRDAPVRRCKTIECSDYRRSKGSLKKS